MRGHAKAASRTRSFTVTELLVVIGMISVLFAMLLGVSSLARSRARCTQCATNRRQVMIASLHYATEHRMSDDAKVDPLSLVMGGYLEGIGQCLRIFEISGNHLRPPAH